MTDQVIKDASAKMEVTVEDARRKLSSIRTGRASVGLLDRIVVESYGTQVPLSQVASISIPEPAMLLVQPWDTSLINAIEKSIMSSDLGITPSNDGKVIRIPLPPLNEERRKQLVKTVRDIAEEHKAGLRNIRQDANTRVKKLLKDKQISEDQEKDALDKIQKQVDSHTLKISSLVEHKEEEIMKV